MNRFLIILIVLGFQPTFIFSQEIKDTSDFDCDRYFYYLDNIKDYQSGYSITKGLVNISIKYIESKTKIKSQMIVEDYSSSFKMDEYKKQMKTWLDWYIKNKCQYRKEEKSKLYQRYLEIKKRERYKCPCNSE